MPRGWLPIAADCHRLPPTAADCNRLASCNPAHALTRPHPSQLFCVASRGLATTVLEAGLLQSCHATLANAFSFQAALAPAAPALTASSADGAAATAAPIALEVTDDDLAASVLGLWRCCAAYALFEPPLDSFFPLFSQAMGGGGGEGRGVLSAAVFALLDTLCHLPSDAQLVHASVPAKGGEAAPVVAAVAAAEATEATEAAEAPPADAQGKAEDVPPPALIESGQDASLSSRWRFLSAYVPSALTALRTADASLDRLAASAGGGASAALACTDGARRAAASAHLIASYLAALQALQSEVFLPLLPWCEQLASRLAAARSHGACGWALETLRRRSARRVARGSEERRPSRLELGAALDCLLGLVRLLWQLSRTHRGLLAHWARAADAPIPSLLWAVCDALPDAIGATSLRLHESGAVVGAEPTTSLGAASVCLAASAPTGRSLLAAAGRLGHLTSVLLDAIDASSVPLPSTTLAAAATAASALARADSPGKGSAPAHGKGAAMDAQYGANPRWSATRLLSLGLCAASWLRPGDEVACRTLVTSLFMGTRWLGRLLAEGHARDGGQSAHEGATDGATDGAKAGALKAGSFASEAHALRAALLPTFARILELSPAVEKQSRALAAPAPTELSALSLSPSASPLPLPSDWLLAPCSQFGTDAGGRISETKLLTQVIANCHELPRIALGPPSDRPRLPSPALPLADLVGNARGRPFHRQGVRDVFA